MAVQELREGLLPAATRSYEAARQAHGAGQDSLLDLLDAARSLLESQQALMEAEAEMVHVQADLEAMLGCALTELHAAQP